MTTPGAIEKALRAGLHGLSAVGLFVLLTLPAHKYAWMSDIDPATAPELLLDAAGNRLPFTLAVAGAVVVLQGLAAWRGRRLWQRLLSVAVMLATAALWLAKFGA